MTALLDAPTVALPAAPAFPASLTPTPCDTRQTPEWTYRPHCPHCAIPVCDDLRHWLRDEKRWLCPAQVVDVVKVRCCPLCVAPLASRAPRQRVKLPRGRYSRSGPCGIENLLRFVDPALRLTGQTDRRTGLADHLEYVFDLNRAAARQQVHRWHRYGISTACADALATSLGHNPAVIWEDWDQLCADEIETNKQLADDDRALRLTKRRQQRGVA